MWIDSHAHLFDYSHEELIQIINEASEQSVSIIVSTATSIDTARDVVSHCNSFDTVWGASGISPFDILTQPDNWQSLLQELLNHPKMIAVGEIGIDNTNPSYPALNKQLPFYESQLSIAIDHNLPAVIHSRGIENTAIDICKKTGVKKALFHCFTGNIDSLRKLLDCGYFVSFSGIITFKNASIRDLINFVPDNRILIETDTPYLAPVPFRGKKNKPSWVPLIGEEIAKLKRMDQNEFQARIENNFRSLFNI